MRTDDMQDALDYILKHPGEGIKSTEEARFRMKEEEARAKKAAQERAMAREEERHRLRTEALDALIYGKELHVLITVDGERLLKVKGPDDLRCPHCKKPSGKVLGRAREKAELIGTDLNGRTNLVSLDTAECEHCRKTFSLMVQAVI